MTTEEQLKERIKFLEKKVIELERNFMGIQAMLQTAQIIKKGQRRKRQPVTVYENQQK